MVITLLKFHLMENHYTLPLAENGKMGNQTLKNFPPNKHHPTTQTYGTSFLYRKPSTYQHSHLPRRKKPQTQTITLFTMGSHLPSNNTRRTSLWTRKKHGSRRKTVYGHTFPHTHDSNLSRTGILYHTLPRV